MSPEILEVLAEELPVAIWMGEVPSGDVVYTNRAFREVLGIDPPPGAVRGGFVEPYGVHRTNGEPYPEQDMPFERCIAARATVVVDDLVIHRRDGRHVFLRVFAKPIFDAAGNLTHVLEAFTDITREVEAERARIEGERRLARAQRLDSIGQLVTGIAHDFNNLLTVSKLAVSQLLPSEAQATRRRALDDIRVATDSAVALVRNLVDFAGGTRKALAPIELNGVVETVVELARRTFERRLVVSTELAPGGAWLKGDRSQLEQVVMNLLVNARDAIAGDGGHIVVATRIGDLAAGELAACAPGSYVVLEVRDDGPGIDPAIRDRVFEPYFTTKTVGAIKGTGLGLSTVHGIVKSHGGQIEAADAAPRGTIMRIAIPSCAPAVVDVPAARARAPRGQGELVLVVDDERLVRVATMRTLEALGYRTVEADSGDAAVALIDAGGEIAAVALDLVMPGRSAAETFTALRAARPGIPVIVITGSPMHDDLPRLLELGASAWVAKPYAEDDLGRAIFEARSRR